MPNSDLYLFEQPARKSIKLKKNQIYINNLLLQKTLAFMLNCTALKKPVDITYSSTADDKPQLRNAVHYLSERVTSKRFDITMNDERVDVTDTVFDILYERHPKATGVWADGNFKQLYQDARPVERQSLGTCLLTATAFYKLLTES